MGYSFRLAASVLLYASSHIQDNTYYGLCYTNCGALAGTRNSSVGPQWRIDPTIHRTISESSYHGATSRSQKNKIKTLKDRSFKVRLGSILSVTLFSVKINSITQCLKPGVDCSLYVTDFHICYKSSNMSIIERQLQLCLNKLQQRATDKQF